MTQDLRIIVADDDPDLLQDVAGALENMGAAVTRACSGAELMTHLGEDEPYDLVVTDISMPWMTGLQAVLSTRYAGLLTPVLVMTGIRDPKIFARVQALGPAVRLLHKPFSLEQLRHAVNDLVRMSPSENARV